MVISMAKKYKNKHGDEVRILCVDRADKYYPVVGLATGEDGREVTATYTINGKYYPSDRSDADLVEISEWDDFKIDEPVMVRDADGIQWHRRHFARIEKGKPAAWENGKTNWTTSNNNQITTWEQCRRPTKDELL